jgi:hypothetical protein
MHKRRAYVERDGERFMDAVQNARLIAKAEQYYRIMYYGSRASWNLRDSHMFQTLKTLLAFYGSKSKAIVWAHNSHIGDASATEMFSRGEYNLGHLCRKEFGTLAYTIGFGTNAGTVAAASNWDGPMEIKRVVPAVAESCERIFHESGVPNFCLDLSQALNGSEGLRKPRLERAIGVIYRRRRSSPAITSRRCCRSNSMNMSGLTRRRRLRHLRLKRSNARHLSVWLMNELNRTSPIPDAAAVAARLMAEFAMRTGLCPGAQEQRRISLDRCIRRLQLSRAIPANK